MKTRTTEFKSIFLIFLTVVAYTSVFSQPPGYTIIENEADFANRLQKASKSLTSIMADFTQEKHLQYLDAALESKGKFWYSSPDKVRWEYQQPYSYTVIINQGKLNLISDDSQNQFDMNSSEVFEQVNHLMIAAVSGDIFNNENYKVNSYEGNDFYLVILEPVSEHISGIIKQMELYFRKTDLTVARIKMIEPSSDYSFIIFHKQQLNEEIPAKIFQP